MNWEEYKLEFQSDGSLRKIFIKGAGLPDWQTLIDFLRSTEASLDYFLDGASAELPAKIDDIVTDKGNAHLLIIGLNSVTVKCHFHAVDEIELEFEPGEIDSEARAKVIFRLMSTAGRLLKKLVILTTSTPDQRTVFLYEPGAGVGVQYLRQDEA